VHRLCWWLILIDVNSVNCNITFDSWEFIRKRASSFIPDEPSGHVEIKKFVYHVQMNCCKTSRWAATGPFSTAFSSTSGPPSSTHLPSSKTDLQMLLLLEKHAQQPHVEDLPAFTYQWRCSEYSDSSSRIGKYLALKIYILVQFIFQKGTVRWVVTDD
jgi:hypothetical protein